MKKAEFSEESGVNVIKFHGEMTFFFLEELDEYIKEKVKNNKYKFIFDMSDVNWIDSMGLGLLAMAVKVALINNSRVCIVNPKDSVVELLRLSSLVDLVVIHKSIKESIKYFAA